MTDAAQQQEVSDLYSISDDELRAKALELGMSIDDLKLPEYPDFVDGKGFKLQITDAKNTTSPKGASQVELSLAALDEDDKIVKWARSKLWVTYPFDTAAWKFKDIDARERSFNTMQAIVRAQGNPEFQAARRVNDGTKTFYFDRDGNELVGKVKASFDLHQRMKLMAELRRREQNAAMWVGTRFYAQRKYNEGKDGQIYRNWQMISTEPLTDKVEYVFDAKHMLVRQKPGQAVQERHDEAEDLF